MVKPTEPTAPQYLRPHEAAQYLGTSVSTLAKRRIYGGGPVACRIGRAVRYARADLDAFMAASKANSTSERGSQ